MSKIQYQQDMPPPGGYKQITYQRIKNWSPRSSIILAAVGLFTPFAIWDFKTRQARNFKNMLEDDEGRQSLEPLLIAETDRLLLWQMRRNREEENQLMKDVPGWVTGTWFGEPIYKSNPNFDEWVQPSHLEVYAHVRKRDMDNRQYFKNWLN